LEYQYDTSAIYNATPVLNTRGEFELVPSIDQLREHVARAFYRRAGRGLEVPIVGTGEDREDSFQEELSFILAFTPPEP